MKKYLQFFFVALFAAMSFTLTACSDDDDDDKSPLAGTTWKIMTSEEDAEHVGATFTFNADGTMKNPFGWTYAKWTLNGDVLKIVVGEGEADDMMIGEIEFSGQHATYKYHWKDFDGEWSGDETYTMTLQKQ